jgi:hypothetical protein
MTPPRDDRGARVVPSLSCGSAPQHLNAHPRSTGANEIQSLSRGARHVDDDAGGANAVGGPAIDDLHNHRTIVSKVRDADDRPEGQRRMRRHQSSVVEGSPARRGPALERVGVVRRDAVLHGTDNRRRSAAGSGARRRRSRRTAGGNEGHQYRKNAVKSPNARHSSPMRPQL